jgi:hypothetical protein
MPKKLISILPLFLFIQTASSGITEEETKSKKITVALKGMV